MATAISRELPRLPAEVSRAERRGGLGFPILLLCVAVLVGFSLQTWGPDWSHLIFERARLNSFGGITALLVALLASVVAHEFGHLFAALFLNYAVLGGAVGPFRFHFWRRKIYFRLEEENWSRSSISAVPRQIHNVWRGRMLLVVAAGPLVSLLFLVAAASMALAGPGPKLQETWFTAFWSCCAEINFFLVVLGLVPNGRSAPSRNDAGLFLSLWKHDDVAVDLFMCHRAIELTMRGIRPDHYPETSLRELTQFQGRPYTNLIVARRMVEWAIDSGDIVSASQWDEAAMALSAKCSLRMANAVLAESACFDVLFREDMRAAVHKFAKVEFADLFPPSLAERAQAARLVACNLPHRAPAHILRAQYHLPLGDSYFHYERMLLEKLHGRALSQIRPGRLLC